MDLGDYIRQGIGRLKLRQLSDLPGNIRDRVLQSIYWIEHSTTHETDDHKLVDLCTALEILLLPEGPHVRNKGTVIALRHNLLGGGLNPSTVKWMYERRNDVVHGKPLPVVGQQETWHLKSVCYATIRLIIRASTDRPDALKLQCLMRTIETNEKLTAFVELAEQGLYESSLLPDLVKEARKRLKRLDSVSS